MEDAEIMERLRRKMLSEFEKRLDDGEINSTDLATLSRMLRESGFAPDASKLPENLQGKITREVEFDDEISPEEAA